MIHLSDGAPSTIRASLEYSDSMGSTSMYEIHTIDTSKEANLLFLLKTRIGEAVLQVMNRWIPSILSLYLKMVPTFISQPMIKTLTANLL